jgi:transposase
MRPLQLPVPTAEQLTALENLYQKTHNVRERTRAQMVLLALEKHLKAAEIAVIVREDDETVRRWLKRWTAEGVEGLRDRPMPGAPSKITPAYKEQLLVCVRLRPRSLGLSYSMWTLQRLADYLAEQRGIQVSYETIRRLLREAGIVFSRPQHTISSPDPEYQLKKRRLKKPATG